MIEILIQNTREWAYFSENNLDASEFAGLAGFGSHKSD